MHEELSFWSEQSEVVRRSQEIHQISAEHTRHHHVNRLRLQRGHVRGEIGGAELRQLLPHDHDVGTHHLEMREEILHEVLAELVIGRNGRDALHVVAPLQVLGHYAADLHRREVGASDVAVPGLAGKTPRGGESADHENFVLLAEIADRHRRAAVDAEGDELDFLLEDHTARLGDRLFHRTAHVGRHQFERPSVQSPRLIGFIHRDLKAGADAVGDESEAAAVNVNQAELHRFAGSRRLRDGGKRAERGQSERRQCATNGAVHSGPSSTECPHDPRERDLPPSSAFLAYSIACLN